MHDPHRDTYSTTEAAKLAGTTYRNAEYWARIGVLETAVPARGVGSDRRWSYSDVSVLAALVEMADTSVALRRQVASRLRLVPANTEQFILRISPTLSIFLNLGAIRQKLRDRQSAAAKLRSEART